MRVFTISFLTLLFVSSSGFAVTYCPDPQKMETALKVLRGSQLIQSVFDQQKIIEEVNGQVLGPKLLNFTHSKIYADVGAPGSWKLKEKVYESMKTVICTYSGAQGPILEIKGTIIKK
jgi:hypothetical protein